MEPREIRKLLDLFNAELFQLEPSQRQHKEFGNLDKHMPELIKEREETSTHLVRMTNYVPLGPIAAAPLVAPTEHPSPSRVIAPSVSDDAILDLNKLLRSENSNAI